ncbi:hypothetical protein MRB53_008594 [Persea americana]|uniref:Uncharacterized protein n=1 Tax=Persea americana TaxID=3435 RepID=A0ACC2MMH9_PERAE|nr:hypothetical protein MRB53_008594 [Persea americana]
MATTNRMLLPKIAPNGDRVGLLQFADDLLLFLRPNDRTLTNLNQILSMFEEQAGQRINRTKSQLMFSKNASSRMIRATKDALHIQEVTSFDYLGTSLALKCNHRNTWLNTIRRVQNRIAGWRGSTLSPAGRKILIQSVTTAIPNYWLGHHLVPGKVLKQINGMNSQLLLVWDNHIPKDPPYSLGQDYSTKFGKEPRPEGHQGTICCSLRQSCLAFSHQPRGDGSRIDAFKDRWIPSQIDGSPLPRHPNPPPLLVSNLVRLDLHAHPGWNREALQMWWDDDTVANILNIPLAGRDTACWKNEKAGTCQTRSLYNHFQQPTIGPHFPWNILWPLPMPSKHKLFLWKCLLNRLPLRADYRNLFLLSIPFVFFAIRSLRTMTTCLDPARLQLPHGAPSIEPPTSPHPSPRLRAGSGTRTLPDNFWLVAYGGTCGKPGTTSSFAISHGTLCPFLNRSPMPSTNGGSTLTYLGPLFPEAFASAAVANSTLEAELTASLRGVRICLELSICDVIIEGDSLIIWNNLHYDFWHALEFDALVEEPSSHSRTDPSTQDPPESTDYQ